MTSPGYMGNILFRFGGRSKFVRGIAIVAGADEGQNFPKIVGILNDGAERRHRANDVFSALTRITQLLKFVAAKGDEPKQRVVITTVNPDVVGQRRAHAAAAAAAMATAAGIAQ